MKLSPLIHLAAMRVPALTDLFSDAIPIASMAVGVGTLITLTASAPHGIPVNAAEGVCVVDALTPNPITAWELLDNDDVEITVTYPHGLTTTPDVAKYDPHNLTAKFGGTGIAELSGDVQLVSVPTQSTLIVRPSDTVSLPGSIPAEAALLERLEREIIGWHAATAVSPTVLTFPTPASVTRSFAVANPKVARNIRTWGAVDLEHALSHFTRSNETVAPLVDRSYMFVLPYDQATLSRDRMSRSDASLEVTAATDIRQILIDGFEIVVVLPAERYGGAVACVDKCHGPVLAAVMRTFNGLKVPRAELAQPADYLAFLVSHGRVRYDGANYVHVYRFECPAQLTRQDCVDPNEVADVSAIDTAIQAGNPIPTDAIHPFGSVPLNGIKFSPAPGFGIQRQGFDELLTATIDLPAAA